MLLSGDTWFAPSDVTIGPDGAVYVCDWHDQRTAHPDPDAEWDRTNGRIYRIRAAGAARTATRQLSGLSSTQLVGELAGKNDWYVRKARRLLADRRDPEMIFPLRTLVAESADDHLALEALWALVVSGGLSEEFAGRQLEHRSADVRWWTVRLLGDESRVSSPNAARLASVAAHDPSVAVRCQLACTAKRLPSDQALPIIASLLTRGEDASDPYLPMLIWWAVERHAIEAREHVLAMFTDPATWKQPVAHDVVLERLIRRYAAAGTAAGYEACATLLKAAPPTDRGMLLAAIERGLADRSTAREGHAGTLFASQAVVSGSQQPQRDKPAAASAIPPTLAEIVERAWQENPDDVTLIRLAARLGEPAALNERSRSLPIARRRWATGSKEVRVVAEMAPASAVDALVNLLADEEPEPLRLAALRAAQFDGERIAEILLARYSSLGEKPKSKACDVLLSRPAWAARLLAAVDHGDVPAKEIAVDQLRPCALYQDKNLDALVKKHWGSIQGGTPEERLAEMRRISNDLRAGRGNLAAGKALFTQHCGTCHELFGAGNKIGPELTHANRKNTDELLSTIVNPSAVVRKEYLSFLVHSTDGRVLTGLLVDQTPGSVTLLSAKNERIVIARDKIEAIAESPTSLMPENLLSTLKPQELRDLFGYLQSEPAASAAR